MIHDNEICDNVIYDIYITNCISYYILVKMDARGSVPVFNACNFCCSTLSFTYLYYPLYYGNERITVMNYCLDEPFFASVWRSGIKWLYSSGYRSPTLSTKSKSINLASSWSDLGKSIFSILIHQNAHNFYNVVYQVFLQ